MEEKIYEDLENPRFQSKDTIEDLIAEEQEKVVNDVVLEETFFSKLRRENRIGKFRISIQLLENPMTGLSKEALAALFGTVIITRAEYMFVSNVIEYIAFSDHFDTVEEGCVAPLYDVLIITDPETGEFVSLNWQSTKKGMYSD